MPLGHNVQERREQTHEFPHTDNGYLFQAGLAFYPPKEKDVTILAHTHTHTFGSCPPAAEQDN